MSAASVRPDDRLTVAVVGVGGALGAAIAQRLGSRLDLILDGGPGGLEPTTVVDLFTGAPVVVRAGKGDPTPLGVAAGED